MADTAITGRNSCMVHSTAACIVTYMSVCFSAVSVHCCEVLPYGPLYSCLPILYDPLDVCHRVHSVGSTQYSIHVCSRVHSIQYKLLMSVIGSTQPICIVYYMVHSTLVGSCSTVFWTHLSVCHLYSCLLHSGFHCGIHSTAVPGLVHSNRYEIFPLSYFLPQGPLDRCSCLP